MNIIRTGCLLILIVILTSSCQREEAIKIEDHKNDLIKLRAPCEPFGIEVDWVKRYSQSSGRWEFLPNTTVAIEEGCASTITDNGVSGFNNYAIDMVSGNNLQRCFYGDYNWLDGVDDQDLQLINDHIYGIKPFTRLQQYLAADVNWDGEVDARDLLELRKLTLSITSELPAFDEDTGGLNQLNQPVHYVIGDAAYYGTLQQLFASDEPGLAQVLVKTVYPHNTCSVYNFEETSDTGKRYAIKRGDINGDFYE